MSKHPFSPLSKSTIKPPSMPKPRESLEAENARLKAEVERLRKAGDAMACHLVCSDLPNDVCGDLMKNWNAAKEGKPSA